MGCRRTASSQSFRLATVTCGWLLKTDLPGSMVCASPLLTKKTAKESPATISLLSSRTAPAICGLAPWVEEWCGTRTESSRHSPELRDYQPTMSSVSTRIKLGTSGLARSEVG